MSKVPPLGATSIDTFLSDYWQRQPLCIRAGITDLVLPFSGDDLAGLSLQPEVESRLVTCEDPAQPERGFTVTHGPLDESLFQTLPEENWTLLVQATELWIPELRHLLEFFDFLPRWRMDDIMASFATPGGGVGPHFDSYDVFLIQASGERHWQIGHRCDADSALIQHGELATLADFEATDEWLLKPGDILYLPPGVAHWGISRTAGITLSVGFRSPSLNEILDDLTVEVMASAATARLSDPPLSPNMATEEIHRAYISEIQTTLKTLIDDEKRLGEWFARYMTRPKYPDLVDITGELRRAEFDGVSYQNGEISNE